MSDDKQISITVSVAERTYPVKVSNAKEEELIRKVANDLNDKFQHFKQVFEGDQQDFLAMAALTKGTEAMQDQKKVVDDDHACFDKVTQMCQQVDDALSA